MVADKKQVARLAAAKHSTDRVAATIEFGRLTGRLGEVASATDFALLQEEMLAQLPPYRQPTIDEFAEYMIFFSPDCLRLDGKIYPEPPFLDGLSGEQLEAARQYVRDAELKKIDLANLTSRLAELEGKLSRAEKAYARGGRSTQRNARVAQSLGLSSGVPPKRFDKGKIWRDYVVAVRKEGLPRLDALEKVRKSHQINSVDRTRHILFEHRRAILKQWEPIGDPSAVHEIKKRLAGLIPSKR